MNRADQCQIGAPVHRPRLDVFLAPLDAVETFRTWDAGPTARASGHRRPSTDATARQWYAIHLPAVGRTREAIELDPARALRTRIPP
jgi:hypothetical protein